MRTVLHLLLLAAVASAQTGPDPDTVLEQARLKLKIEAHSLENYVCVETVNRSYFRRVAPRADTRAVPGPAPPPSTCGESESVAPRRLESTDRVRLEVTLSQGHELHSWPGATRFDTRDIDELIRDGPVSTGSFGAYLTGVFDRPGVIFHFSGKQSAEGHTVFTYGYKVPLDASRFEVKAAGAWRAVPFEGEIWLNPQTLELEKLTVRADEVPSGAAFCQASNTLQYQYARIGGNQVLLPRQAQLEIVHLTGRETRNVITFANCREYHAESEVVFDLPAETETAAVPRAGRGRVALPLGLPVTLALETPIDSETSAAGDNISAKVVKPVRRTGSSDVLVPAGAIVYGRIRRVEHHLTPEPYFLFVLSFNRVDVKGAISPFMARSEPDPELAKSLDATAAPRGTGIWNWGEGTFLFPTSKPHYTIPAGEETKWFTLATGGGPPGGGR